MSDNQALLDPQDLTVPMDSTLADDLDKASQLVTEIKRKAMDVESLLQEDIRASQSSSCGASIFSIDHPTSKSPGQRNSVSGSAAVRSSLPPEERQVLTDRINQLEDDLRIEKLKNKSLCETYTTDVADLMSRVSDLKTFSTANSTQLFLQPPPQQPQQNPRSLTVSNNMLGTSLTGMPDLGQSVGTRLLRSGYIRDDASVVALSTDGSTANSAVLGSSAPQMGMTLTASRVNPGFMGRLGPEYPNVYDHRYATISTPDVDTANGAAATASTVSSRSNVHHNMTDSIPEPAPDYAPSVPVTPGPTSFKGVINVHPAVISNYPRILKMMACSKLGTLSQLNVIASSMTGSIMLTPPLTNHSTPAGAAGAQGYALTPMTDFLKRPQSPSTLANLSMKRKENEPYGRPLQSPGARRPNYQVRMDITNDMLKTPVTGQDLVNPALIQNLEFVRLYLSNQLEQSDQVKSMYRSITSMPEFQSAVQLMIDGCVEEALTATSLLEAKTVENNILRARVDELESALTDKMRTQAEDRKDAVVSQASPSIRFGATRHEAEDHTASMANPDMSITTISQLEDRSGANGANANATIQAVLSNYESTINTLTHMINSNATETLKISADESEQRREKEIYKAKLQVLSSSFEKIAQSNYELQKQLDTLQSQTQSRVADRKDMRLSQLYDELQACRAETNELKAQLERARAAAGAVQDTSGDNIPVDLMVQTLVDCIAAKTGEVRQLEQSNKRLAEENTNLKAELQALRTRLDEMSDQQSSAEKNFNDMRSLLLEEAKILKEENTILAEEKRLTEYKNGLLQKKLKTLNDLNECEYMQSTSARGGSVSLGSGSPTK